MMRLNFYATLRAAADGKTVEVDLPAPASVSAVLRRVTELKPKLARELWDEQGKLRDYIKVFVNGRELAYLPDGIETLLHANDELDIFPPVGGGKK
jgi:MoaD family protein